MNPLERDAGATFPGFHAPSAGCLLARRDVGRVARLGVRDAAAAGGGKEGTRGHDGEGDDLHDFHGNVASGKWFLSVVDGAEPAAA